MSDGNPRPSAGPYTYLPAPAPAVGVPASADDDDYPQPAGMTTRRSERLRARKVRQSTPGLSKPGAYTLYGSGYVVESEASFATSSQFRLPADSRRARYAESPHCLQVETSAPADEPRRRASLLDSVRVSFPDILRRNAVAAYGHAKDVIAKSPLARRARATMFAVSAPESADEEDEVVPEADDDDDEEEVDDDGQGTTTLMSRLKAIPTPRQLADAFFELPQAQRTRSYMFLLAALLAASIMLLLALASIAQPRAGRSFAAQDRLASISMPSLNLPRMPQFETLTMPKMPQFERPAMPSLRTISFGDLPAMPDFSLPSMPDLPPMPTLPLREIQLSVSRTVSSVIYYVRRAPGATFGFLRRFLFGGAWRSRMGSISRAEFADDVYPALLAEMRRVAQEEISSESAFSTFRERYSADKGLPADYALASAGALVISADPSPIRQYARFIYAYASALVRPSAFSPALPRSPDTALHPNVSPGMCWAFPGSKGSLDVRLARPVAPRAVTVEHTPADSAFGVHSAPARFRIHSVPLDAPAAAGATEQVLLGEFQFARDGGHIQTFSVPDMGQARAVRIEIVTNHGGAYTCLYRFRVHGEAVEL